MGRPMIREFAFTIGVLSVLAGQALAQDHALATEEETQALYKCRVIDQTGQYKIEEMTLADPRMIEACKAGKVLYTETDSMNVEHLPGALPHENPLYRKETKD